MDWEPFANCEEDGWRVGIPGLPVFGMCLRGQILNGIFVNHWLFSFRLCCHYQRKTGTSCFNQWWKVSCLQVCNTEVGGKTVIHEISWFLNKGFYKNGNRNLQKYVSPLSIFFDSLTCCSRFLPDANTILILLMSRRSRCWWWRHFCDFGGIFISMTISENIWNESFFVEVGRQR